MQDSVSRQRFLGGLATLAVVLGLHAPPASAQPTEVDAAVAKAKPTDVYAIKFLCGSHQELSAAALEGPVKPGNYLTAINVHNPNGGPVTFRKKAILMFRDDQPAGQEFERPMQPNGFRSAQLPPNWGLEIDCADIRIVLLNTPANPPLPPPPPPPVFIKGWVILEVVPQPHQGGQPPPLDVTAVYTSHGYRRSDTGLVEGEGFSTDVESISPKQVKK